MIKKIIITALSLLFLLLVLGISWSHPVLVRAIQGENCSPDLLEKGKKRVAAFYGESLAAPMFLCLSKPTLGLDVGYGSARFVPVLPTIIIVGPFGLNEDVVAHEFAHDELRARTSSLLRTFHIPTWFDEGLAMQVDHRPAYSLEALGAYLKQGDLDKPSLGVLTQSGNFLRQDLRGDCIMLLRAVL